LDERSAWVSVDVVITQDVHHPADPELWDEKPARAPSWYDYMPIWHAEAHCRDIVDWDETYFGDTPESRASMSAARFRKAQSTCAGCPVIESCAVHAITQPEEFGIWAGTTPLMRQKARDLMGAGIISLDEIIEVIVDGAAQTFKELADAIDTGLRDVI
jgi:hypothetical protein